MLSVHKYVNLPDGEIKYEADGKTLKKHSDEEQEAIIKNRMAISAFFVAFIDCDTEDCMTCVEFQVN